MLMMQANCNMKRLVVSKGSSSSGWKKLIGHTSMNFMLDDLKLTERIYVNELNSHTLLAKNNDLEDWRTYFKSGIMALVSKNAVLGHNATISPHMTMHVYCCSLSV
jgi:hypothetical protein